ncbi:similar to Saccharomyces cerevisiae YJR118C ILM1 Protein of unknown function [Maudiozyma barnettii]|uniref:Protein ILM1 n=1 Tax=Maudiozyma barnettii TaxID=61262 RepID=A0A8H2VHV4_9SACH|nr:Ilm1p [Kazachstania barnettii]CAB4255613.1 similar to Saccharomyces cerevisiae YJR118C ILM1 Protein of unknown function [Kazachstania barnettii]CAD1784174.1 similar to Saccharomyces cerevisiae YJR118C ILM1 Protein of unknown function [Kazachstania barnettii]
MTVLTSVNVLYFRVAYLCSLGFFCFKNVNSILDNSYFLVFTQAMDLPQLTMSQYSAQLGLFGVLFGMLAFTDLIPLLEDNKTYFYSIVPIRLLAYFVIATLSYTWKSNLFLHNNVIFIYCFSEIWINFVIYNSLREEKEVFFRSEEKKRYIDESIDDEDEAFGTATLEIEETITTETVEEVTPEESIKEATPKKTVSQSKKGKKKNHKKKN